MEKNETYVIDYYDEIDGGHYIRQSSNLLYLLTFVSHLQFTWNIVARSATYQFAWNIVARSATYQGV